jgi:O-antigen/teichoic acid export membrane protein
VRRLWSSPTLRSALVYGASGLGFSGANLILARVLPTAEYAVFTLVIALVNLSYALAPVGVDGMVQRRHLDASPSLLKRTVSAGLLVGAVAVFIAGFSYQLDNLLLLLMFTSTVAGGTLAVAGAQFQSEQRFGISLWLTQSPNLVLIIAAVAVVISGVKEALLPLLISAVGMVLAAAIGWGVLFRERNHKPLGETWFPWGEALSLAGLNAAGHLLTQLDRLIIPYVLPLHELATYGVLVAIAGSLFRVLSLGVGYTMVPRLRAAGTVEQRRRLLAQEARLVGGIIVFGSIAIWFVTPWVEQSFLAGKYHLSGSLLVAAIFVGIVKIMNSFTKAAVTALATGSEVSTVNLLGWVSVGVAVAAAIVGSRWGLAGVIYGVGLGWLARALAAAYLILRHLKLPASIPAAAR